jgi:ligand-binding sensor protein/putative methionine-R-sulfoxide reductase with GAF domain
VRIHLKDLISVKEWQEIQDNFANIIGVALQTLDSEGKSVTRPSGLPGLCTELLKNSPLKNEVCAKCLPTFLGGSAILDKNLGYFCVANGMGTYNFLVPLKSSENNVAGYVLVGPVFLVIRKLRDEYIQVAERLSVDVDALWNAVLDIRVISYQGMRSLSDFIREIGEYALRLAHEHILMKKGAGIAEDVAKFIRLFDSLLDVAFEISKADIGSVMFLDKNKGNLTIRASKGIPEEIVSKTNVKVGEGISGIAAKEGTPFIIDDNLRDNRIKKYLSRSDIISSSMVLPLKVRNQVLGVMNLGVLRTSPVRFGADNLKSMRKLVELAAVASQ